MFAAVPWTTMATKSNSKSGVLEVKSTTATNGLVFPVAIAAYPPTNVVTATEESAEAMKPNRMSRRVGVYGQKSAMWVKGARDEPHATVTNVANPAQVNCCELEWKTADGEKLGSSEVK